MKNASNILKAVIITTILLFLLVFAFQNLNPVSVDFFNLESKEIPLFIILIGVLSLGILMGYFIGLISASKITKQKLEKLSVKLNVKIADAEEKAKRMTTQIEKITPLEK